MIENIKEIISTLKVDPSISFFLGDRYSIGEPKEIPTGMYCIFKTVSVNDLSQVEQRSRVQMFLISGDYDSLSSCDKLIKVKLMNTKKIGNFKYHSISTSGGLEGISPLKEKTFTRDFIFKYDLNDYGNN